MSRDKNVKTVTFWSSIVLVEAVVSLFLLHSPECAIDENIKKTVYRVSSLIIVGETTNSKAEISLVQ